jgi:hypothetical protein
MIWSFALRLPEVVWDIVSIMIAMVMIIIIVALWNHIKWWWVNTWASFPLIGRIATLSKDLNRDSIDKDWFKAEKALCRDFKKFIRIQDEHDFLEKIEYLNKAGDNGRRATPYWIWFLTVAMVFVEALGFSYVLAGYTLPGASENLQQTGAYGIAFLISIILVALTHFAGHELHQSSHIKNARREWIEDGRKNRFTTGNIPLAKPQSTDDGQPAYTQLANRVGTQESYKIAGLTLVFVIVVAVFATYVRGQVLEKSLHDEVVGMSTQIIGANPANSDGLNMAEKNAGDSLLPDADIAQNQAAKDKAVIDGTNIDRHGGWGTFIVLAFVFVFLQILGVLFGFRWGFAGQNSEAAYQAIGRGRYTAYADVREHYKEIADAAQAKLENLQQKLMDRNAQTGICTDGMHTTKTFYDFMELCRQEESRDRVSQRQHTVQNAALSQVSVTKSAQNTETHTSSEPLTIDEAVRQLNSLNGKDAKKDYIHSLPQPLQGDVLKAIKAAKEAEKANAAQQENEARAQLDAELDDLL